MRSSPKSKVSFFFPFFLFLAPPLLSSQGPLFGNGPTVFVLPCSLPLPRAQIIDWLQNAFPAAFSSIVNVSNVRSFLVRFVESLVTRTHDCNKIYPSQTFDCIVVDVAFLLRSRPEGALSVAGIVDKSLLRLLPSPFIFSLPVCLASQTSHTEMHPF